MSIAAHPRVKQRRNDFDFTSAGPDSPGGKLLRRSWQPVYISEKLKAGSLVPLHVFGERFTLYRGESGAAHLVGFRCAHRRTQLSVAGSAATTCNASTTDGRTTRRERARRGPGERPPVRARRRAFRRIRCANISA